MGVGWVILPVTGRSNCRGQSPQGFSDIDRRATQPFRTMRTRRADGNVRQERALRTEPTPRLGFEFGQPRNPVG